MKFTLKWFKAALIRAARTSAQVALGMFTVGSALHEVNWLHILSVAAVSAIYSLLTSVATKLPELEKEELITDGSMVIDETDPDAYGIFVNLGETTVDEVAQKKQVVLAINTVKNSEGTEGEKSEV